MEQTVLQPSYIACQGGEHESRSKPVVVTHILKGSQAGPLRATIHLSLQVLHGKQLRKVDVLVATIAARRGGEANEPFNRYYRATRNKEVAPKRKFFQNVSVKTFGQNLLGPKPYTISINPGP